MIPIEFACQHCYTKFVYENEPKDYLCQYCDMKFPEYIRQHFVSQAMAFPNIIPQDQSTNTAPAVDYTEYRPSGYQVLDIAKTFGEICDGLDQIKNAIEKYKKQMRAT